MRIDPDGVVNLGRDGVLRSLNADLTVVLDYRRLSPEELRDFASPADQATRDALTGIDGRDVTDVEQLWAVPDVKVSSTKSSHETPIERAGSLFKRAACNDYSCRVNKDCPNGGPGDPVCPICSTGFSPGFSPRCRAS